MNIKDWYDITQAQRIERIDQAVRVLVNLPRHERRKHWYMGSWGEQTLCGTSACAAGHCGLDTWFRRRGLSLKFDGIGEPVGNTGRFYGGDVLRFFGEDAAECVFVNGAIRTVSDAIRALKKYAKDLRAGVA